MTNFIQNRGNFSSTINTNRLHSPNIWANCPIEQLQAQRLDGTYFFDDFHGLAAQTLSANAGHYYFFGDTGGTCTQVADTDQGQMVLTTDATDEDGIGLVRGNAAGWARFGPTDRVWFEGRYAPGGVGDTTVSSFLGFCEVNVVPAGDTILVDSTGVLDASEDFIGWRTILGNGDFWEPIYQEGAATLKAVGADGTANATGSGYGGVVAANTMEKWGLTWDGPTNRLTYYKAGLAVAYIEVTSALSFPDVNHMAMVIAGKAHTAAAATWNLDWWAGAALTL